MTDHFEDLWERAEKNAEIYYDGLSPNDNFNCYDVKGVIGELQDGLHNLKISLKANNNFELNEIFGKILFDLSFLSQKLNINTYAALKEVVEDIKIKMLDPDIDNKNT